MALITPLSQWLVKTKNYRVAVNDGVNHNVDELGQLSARWYHSLRGSTGSRIAVYHEDAFEFTAILFALWQLGKTACIPGDNCSGTVQRLKTHVDGFVGQFEQSSECIVQGYDNLDVQWRELAPDFVALEIYTSGSTGEPKPIGKTFNQLEQEIEILESLWPSDNDNVIISTVSHQHFYGMMFRLFRPLCTHKTFEKYACSYSEDIYYHAKRYSCFVLISSPSHLTRLNTQMDWDSLQGKCNQVFSSAAPLQREDSLKASVVFSTRIEEVYGSSETGAIAWRCQQESDTDAFWQALPSVSLNRNENQALLVQAPHLGGRCEVVLTDKVTFNSDGKFQLIGRMDRIVKVEGKRVSLNAIEARLEVSSLVSQAKALVLTKQRVETVVVIELTIKGWHVFKKYGRKALIKQFKGQLAPYFENVVLPRRWRFVDSFPCNSNGKILLGDLEVMFEKERLHWPTVMGADVSENKLTLHCFVSEDSIYFKGHFEKQPVLPGVVQVHWAQVFAKHYLGFNNVFSHLEVIKFQRVIMPSEELEVKLLFDTQKLKLIFSYESEKGVHSSGRICFK